MAISHELALKGLILTCGTDSGSNPKLMGLYDDLTADCETKVGERGGGEEQNRAAEKLRKKGKKVFENVQLALARHTSDTTHHKPALVPVYSRILILF